MSSFTFWRSCLRESSSTMFQLVSPLPSPCWNSLAPLFSIKICPSEVLCGLITVLYQHTQQTTMFLLSLKTLPADLQSSVEVLAVLAWLRFAAVLLALCRRQIHLRQV